MSIFARRLKELRLENGMTQQYLAGLLNIKQQSYIRYEYGTGEPSLETLIRLTEIFGVTSDYLLGISDEF
ncbi:MAG: helix-turn-helix domain-containing protein [Roseburia sp.]|nr:helix-turn-helix domain-containing protein [Roseburia sp.]